jgi:hypothetical protein
MRLFSRLFRSATTPTDAQKAYLSDVQGIVVAYRAALMSRTTIVADSSELPYPKHVIKAALIAAIKTTTDVAQREQLRSAFVGLSGWQDGVGGSPQSFEVGQADLDDPVAAMHRIAAASKDLTAIPGKVAAEGEALFAELKALGL